MFKWSIGESLGLFRSHLCCRVLLISSILALQQCSLQAAPKTWSGAAGTLWSTGINWTPAGAPANGDDLIFPAGAPNTINTNDLVGRTISSISFNGAAGGYALRGNAITLTGGIVAAHTAGDNDVDLPLTLGASQTFTVTSGGTLDVNANINLNSFNLTNNLDFSCRLDGRISGVGELRKVGSGGPLAIGGALANTFTGPTVVVGGTVTLGKTAGVTAISGDLFIGNGGAILDTVRLLTDDQIADTADVIMDDSGVFDLNNQNESIATLTMEGGQVTTGTGTLTNGNITTLASSETATIDGNLHLGNSTRTFNIADGLAGNDMTINANIAGGSTTSSPFVFFAGITKTGPGVLVLSGNNNYVGPTTINGGLIQASSDTAFGGNFTFFPGTFPGTIINTGAVRLSNVDIGAEALIINDADLSVNGIGVSSWGGLVTLNTNTLFITGGTLAFSNSFTGPGGFTIESSVAASVVRLAGTNNTFLGDVTLEDGTLQLAKTNGVAIPTTATLTIGDGDNTDTVLYLDDNQIGNSVPIVFANSGVLNLNGFVDTVGTLTFNGGLVTTGLGDIGTGNITANAASVTATINGRLTFTGNRTLNIADGAASPCDLEINAIVEGAGGIIKTGAGTLCLNGANTYGGATTINAGTVRADHNTALGAVTAATTVNAGAALAFDLLADLVSEPLTIAGTGPANDGALQLLTGGLNINTNIALSAASTINTIAGSLLIDGTISGTGPLTKIGTGTLTLGGASPNTHTGETFVNAGTLQMDKSSGGAIPLSGRLVVGDGTTTATARNLGSAQLERATVNQGSLWDLNGFIDAIAQLTLNEGGDVTTGAGSLQINGSYPAPQVDVNGPFPVLDNSTISGNMTFLFAPVEFEVADGAGLLGSDGAELSISAVITGTNGLVKTGPGDLSLSGANTYSGATTVEDGELRISSDTALGSPAGSTTLNNDAVLSLFNNISVGPERLFNNSTGEPGLGPINNEAGSNSWAGPILMQVNTTVRVDAGSFLNLIGLVTDTLAEDLTKTGAGTLIFSGSGANSYDDTIVTEGTLELAKTALNGAIPGDLQIGDGSGAIGADVVRLLSGSQIVNTGRINILGSGLLDVNVSFETTGSVEGSGRIDLGSGTLDAGSDHGSSTFSGLIFGTGALQKNGNGVWTLTGNNTYTGTTTINGDGALIVNGSQPQSHVTITDDATLGGNGTVGNINCLGSVSPGASPGILTSSNTFFGPGTFFNVEINSLSPGSYDRLSVRGTNNISGATLNVTVDPFFAATEGNEFIILANDGGEAITGTFVGLPNGSHFTEGAFRFRINYNGGTGNDVVLTITNTALTEITAVVSSGNLNGAIDPGECNLLHITLTNIFGAPVNGITTTLAPQSPGVSVTQPFSDYPNIAIGGRGTNSTPFQISTSPNLACGTNVDLALIVTTSTHGLFTIPLTLPTGSAGAAQTFNSAAAFPVAIPDGAGFVDIPINVAGFSTRLKRVVVLLHITHGSREDLDFSLIGPDGTTVLLSSDNGGLAADYGVDCGNGRTVFDDRSGTSIIGAGGTLAAAFRPEQPLSAFNEKFGPDVNGTWLLRVADDTPGSAGSVRCAAISLARAECSAGGGECESCPERRFFGFLSALDPTQTDILVRNNVSSTCGTPKVCPGVQPVGARRFRAFTFHNGESNACITVTLNSSFNFMSAAYSDRFNPANLCQNYMADSGTNTGPSDTSLSYSFNVRALAVFVVVVNQVGAADFGNFGLSVTGGSCRPVLNIAQDTASTVVLDWSTAAIGYELERTNDMSGGAGAIWLPVPGTPRVINGHFSVTNSISGNANFYRLRQP